MAEKKQIGPRITVDTYQKLETLVKHFEQFEKTNPFGKVSKDAVVELAIKEMYENYCTN